MSYIKNTLAHRINPTGHQWVAPGQVVLAADEDHAAYESCTGVEPSNVDDYNAQREAYDRSKTALMERNEANAAARTALQNSRISAPLQVVHGDDEAPFGPPTGTISTKALEASKDAESRRAFAEGEALEKVPGAQDVAHSGSVKPNSPKVHNEQVDAKEAVEEVAQAQAQADSKPRKKPGPKPKSEQG